MIVRAARPDEADALTDLCLRSKASWGFDDAFMAASREALTLTADRIRRNGVWVADGGDSVIGLVALVPAGVDCELDLLFVEPGRMRGGIGRALLIHAIGEARALGARRLVILADPHAETFYTYSGAIRIGEAPSDAIPGRKLPLMAITL